MYRTVLDRLSRTHIEDLILDVGLLEPARLEAAQAEQDQTGATLSDVLLDSQTLEEWDLAKLVASHYSLPFVDVKLYSTPSNVFDLLPLDWCRRHSVLPFDQFGKSITLACVEIPKPEVLREITEKTGCTPFLYVCLRRALRDVIDENLKRRAKAPQAAAASAAVSAKSVVTAAKPLDPAAADVPKEAPSAAPDSTPGEVAPERPRLPSIVGLPRVSLQLTATAAQAASTPAPATQPRRPAIERFARPAAAATPAGGAAPQRLSPMQQILSHASPDPPAATEPAAPPTLPRAVVRAVPKLPSKPMAAPRAAAMKSTHSGDGWESIVDIGEDAVRRTPSDG